MRIVWKDSPNGHFNKPIKYRGFIVTGYKNAWITNIPNDKNVYKNHYCAENAIEAYLGIQGLSPKRARYGIQIIGQIEEEDG